MKGTAGLDVGQEGGRSRSRRTKISLAEASEQIGLPLESVREMVRTGQFCPIYRLTRQRVVVDQADLDAWLQSKRVEPGGAPAAEDVA